jgi:neutral ceramidase
MKMATGLKLGAAKQEVTPPTGLKMAGYGGRDDPAVGTHLALWARAFVCGEGGGRVALVVVDVVGFSDATTQEIRRAVNGATGISTEHILIATTHTHSGPVTTKFRSAIPDPDYMVTVTEGIVSAVCQAAENQVPVKLGYDQVQEPEFHHNRRNEGQPIDSTLGLARFVDEAGQTVASWVDYACHPTILTGKNFYWSTDFPGVLCDDLEDAWGGVAAFFNGCLGDVGPYRPEQNFAEVEKIGKGIARITKKLGEGLAYSEVSGSIAESVRVNVSLDEIPTEDQLKELAKSGGGYEPAWASDQLEMRASGETIVTEVDLEVQGFRVGDLFLACFPGQLFGSWGIELRERWPNERVMLVNQANAHAGYFPSKTGWDLGGYEVRSAFKFNSDLPAPMTWEAGQKLVDAAVEMGGGK